MNWTRDVQSQSGSARETESTLAEAIAPGVWWLHRTRGSNVFLAETASHGLILFDTGFSSSLPGILEEVEALRPGARITHLFLTHHHADHAGAAAVLRGHYGALVVAGAADCRQDDHGGVLLRTQIGTSHRRRRILRRFLARGRPTAEVVVDRPLSGEVE
ncbi:MAG: MBL fold metallo-hydrolase, partial [Dehalococcoidia bacterium]